MTANEERVYQVVLGDRLSELVEKVNRYILEGWHCVGGVVQMQDPTYSSPTFYFAQSMIRGLKEPTQ